jgi:O-antigen biosynthesis protein
MSHELTVSLLNIDRAALTIQVLEPLAALSGQGWLIQVVLVDNGSRADELTMLQDWVTANQSRFEELQFVASPTNLGVSGGRNLAFTRASHDRLLILDNDVILPEDVQWLAQLARTMELEPLSGIVAPMLVFADRPDTVQATGIGLTKTGRVGYLNRNKEAASIAPARLDVVAAPAACWLVRRDAQQAVGLFSEMYHPMQYEDVDFCLRLRVAGWKVVCDPGVRIAHIENVTTRSLTGHAFARTSVRNAMLFREKWSDLLPQVATLTEDDISW